MSVRTALMIRIKKQRAISIIVAIMLCAIVPAICIKLTDLQGRLAARQAVQELGGYWSVEPGWPGGMSVGLGVLNCGEMSASSLEAAIKAQRHNDVLEYLSLEGQVVSAELAQAISGLSSLECINISKCDVSGYGAECIAAIASLRIIYVDPANVQLLSDATAKVGSSVTVEPVD